MIYIRSMIHFDLSFVCVVRCIGVGMSSASSIICWKDCIFSIELSLNLCVKISWLSLCRSISVLYFLVFLWFMGLCFSHYYTILTTIALKYVLRLDSLCPPTLVFFFRIVLAILDPLLFLIILESAFVYPQKFLLEFHLGLH